MQSTLPNEPLQIVITEAGSENLLFRSLLRQAMIWLICGDVGQRKSLADTIAVMLDDVTPETCPVCEEIIFADCRCGG